MVEQQTTARAIVVDDIAEANRTVRHWSSGLTRGEYTGEARRLQDPVQAGSRRAAIIRLAIRTSCVSAYRPRNQPCAPRCEVTRPCGLAPCLHAARECSRAGSVQSAAREGGRKSQDAGRATEGIAGSVSTAPGERVVTARFHRRGRPFLPARSS